MNRYNRRNRNRNMSGRDRGSGLRTSVRIEDDSGRLIPSIRRKETNTGPVGAHGYGSSGACNQMQQECSAANGYVSSYTTPPFCSCNTVNAFVWDVQGVNFNYGDCDYYADWDGFSECVMETHSNNLALGQYQLEQMSTTDMHQNCNFDMSSCLLSAYGGGGFGGGNIGFKEQTGTSPGKSGFGMRRGGRIRRRRRR